MFVWLWQLLYMNLKKLWLLARFAIAFVKTWPFFNYFSLLVLEWLFSRENLQIFAK